MKNYYILNKKENRKMALQFSQISSLSNILVVSHFCIQSLSLYVGLDGTHEAVSVSHRYTARDQYLYSIPTNYGYSLIQNSTNGSFSKISYGVESELTMNFLYSDSENHSSEFSFWLELLLTLILTLSHEIFRKDPIESFSISKC